MLDRTGPVAKYSRTRIRNSLTVFAMHNILECSEIGQGVLSAKHKQPYCQHRPTNTSARHTYKCLSGSTCMIMTSLGKPMFLIVVTFRNSGGGGCIKSVISLWTCEWQWVLFAQVWVGFFFFFLRMTDGQSCLKNCAQHLVTHSSLYTIYRYRWTVHGTLLDVSGQTFIHSEHAWCTHEEQRQQLPIVSG